MEELLLKKSHLIILLYLTNLGLICNSVLAQGLCDKINRPADALEGDFKTVGDIALGCSPLIIKLQNLSGGTDVRYDFYYNGKAAAALDTVGNKDSTNTYFSNNRTTVYTILQYGKKNGKKMYACKTITVRHNSKPYFPSPTNCGPANLTLEIPVHPKNDFNSYEIDWGDNSPKEIVNNLPYNKTHNYSMPLTVRNISVNGIYNGSVCASSSEVITMDGKGGQPKINSIELLSGGDKIEIDLDGYDKPYELFARNPLSSTNYPSNPLTTIKGGKTILNLPFKPQTCFTVFDYPNCPKTSGEICTNNINDIKVDALNNALKWDAHKLGKTNVGFVNLDATSNSISRKLIKTDFNNPSFLSEILVTSELGYTDAVDCKKTYCYQLISEVKGNTSGSKMVPYEAISISEKKCISRDSIAPTAISDVYLTVNDNNLIELEYNDNSGWNVPKDSIVIFKSLLNQNDFQELKTLKHPFGAYLDTDVKTDLNVYEYKIVYKDICGSRSKPSPPISNIKLSSKDGKNLKWSVQSPFGHDSMAKYEILELDENTNAVKKIITAYDVNIHEHLADLSNFNKEAKFKIIVYTSSGVSSSSNILIVPINVEIYLPNIFSPNQDLKNDFFEIKGQLGGITHFSLNIFDRWGSKIYHSDNQGDYWDGKTKGIDAPNGNYFYTIDIETSDKKTITQSGQFIIIR